MLQTLESNILFISFNKKITEIFLVYSSDENVYSAIDTILTFTSIHIFIYLNYHKLFLTLTLTDAVVQRPEKPARKYIV